MGGEQRWRIVLNDGKDRTALWFGTAPTAAEAEAMALADRPGWRVQECDRLLWQEPGQPLPPLD